MLNNNFKKSHKVLTALLVVLFLLIVGVIALIIYQKDNIDAVFNSIKYSKEDIQQQIDDSKNNVKDTLKEYNIDNLRDFTFEEEEQIRRGEITYEEALKKIMEESGVADKLTVASGGNSNNQSPNASSSANAIPDVKANSNNAQDIVAEYAVKMYGLKAYYLGQIGNLVDSAKADYKAKGSLKSIASDYLGRAASLEGEADSAVDALLNELKGKLEGLNADTSVIKTMKNAYENEKVLKKSYYLSLYQSKK